MVVCMYWRLLVLNIGKVNITQTKHRVTLSLPTFWRTACLWICVCTSDRDSVGTCRVVIDWLISCYGNRVLPHYFIPEQNLIGHLSESMCKKVHDWLVCVRDDLYSIILSSVNTDGHLPVVIGDMCRQLQVSPVSPDCDYRELVSTLCGPWQGQGGAGGGHRPDKTWESVVQDNGDALDGILVIRLLGFYICRDSEMV